MKTRIKLGDIQKNALDIIKNPALTYEQQSSQLAKLAENSLDYPISLEDDFYKYFETGEICDLGEGHAPFAPRYILPDYEKFLKEGSKFLRLHPAENLDEALNHLLIFYHHVPSVTRFPVFIGRLDELLEPFIQDETEEELTFKLKLFLNQIDRTINDSFCHGNIGPKETRIGNTILDLLGELQNVTPNLTLLYDEEITPDAFAEKTVSASLESANPAFANYDFYNEDFKDKGDGRWGICSCYNALPIAGGAFTLSRIRLSKIAEQSENYDDFFNNRFPKIVDTMLHFMESKIHFLVEETPFFEENFLIKENFITLENFVGLFGIVGMHECVETLLSYQGVQGAYGKDEKTLELATKILDQLEKQVQSFKSKYSTIWNHEFMLHSQVGAAEDDNTSAGVRIQIGREPEIYDHILHAGKLHKYFPSGVGDHFPFEETAKRNPRAIVDLFKGAFQSNMRYISSYADSGDLIRVTGYLVKKSDIEKYNEQKQISYDTVQYAQDAYNDYGLLDRKVRNV